MAKISDLSEATAVADSDVMHLRTSGGVDKKITGQYMRNTTVGGVLVANSGGTTNLSAYTTNLKVVCKATSAITTEFTNNLPEGFFLHIANQGDDPYTIIVEGKTYVLGLEEYCEFYSAEGDMLLAGEFNFTEEDDSTAVAHEIKKGERKFFTCSAPTAATYSLSEGTNASPLDRVTIFNNTANTATVTDGTTPYSLAGGQLATFAFIDGTLRWVSAGWETIFEDNTYSSQTLDYSYAGFTRPIAEGDYISGEVNTSEGNFYFELILGSEDSYGSYGQGARMASDVSQSRLDSGSSSADPQRVRIWHEGI